ncbi:MAG: putative 2-aminoethylphosphonate ABC transporter permease subunit [Rhodobacterales bacterium]|jgi:iron(III) transport system permease protein|nr:putative 2-aminoethylphosphonate ABC transporter permease subunit [Rhodobacterales bacterium]MBT4323035.1 putative 2-aminoethylphosphonate ABC transporter permease subunit [Rhodobacterales bacterium]MBT4974573.1 putative 2-aminoethylphosphonate ABC transporter permease subunit [Gammaproteobacteria bacterium]
MTNNIKNNPILKQKSSKDDLTMRVCMGIIGLFLAIAIILPLYTMFSKSLENKEGNFIGINNYIDYFSTPALFQSAYNSILISIIGTIIVLLFAFIYAYALTRTKMPFKWFFKIIAIIPLLTPSMLSGISLVYWFGNQGIAKSFLMGESIFGPIGIVMGSVYWVFPHALMIIITALSITDARLYEAATALRTSKIKTFFMVTIPNCKFGLISAGFVVFTLIFTDFGVPKVIGGSYNVLATDIYKQVIGQQNFQMGAVVAVVLLTPAIIAFSVDRFVQRKQVALLSASAVPYQPKKNKSLDLTMLIFCSFVAFLIICMIGMAQYAAIIKFWPYNLSFTLENFNFDLIEGGGWGSYFNSIKLSVYSALVGSILIFFGAYLVEKGRGFNFGRNTFHGVAMIPLAVPGMALGLAYIFFFNNPNNPLSFLYGTMGILVISTITHFYTVSHLTATTALKQMDKEFESVSASLKTPFFRSFKKITVPICMPAILDISVYLFLNAMTTVSAVIFLYSADTRLASIAVLNMDDQGELAMAAAMAMMIAYTCGGVRILYAIGTNSILVKTQRWRFK